MVIIMLTYIEEACQYVHVPLVAEYELEDQVQLDGQQFFFFCHARILVWKVRVGKYGAWHNIMNLRDNSKFTLTEAQGHRERRPLTEARGII